MKWWMAALVVLLAACGGESGEKAVESAEEDLVEAMEAMIAAGDAPAPAAVRAEVEREVERLAVLWDELRALAVVAAAEGPEGPGKAAAERTVRRVERDKELSMEALERLLEGWTVRGVEAARRRMDLEREQVSRRMVSVKGEAAAEGGGK